MKTPFLTSPAVFAAGSSYQIMAVADIELLYWVEVNGRNYYDSSNGVLGAPGDCSYGRIE